MFFSRDCTVLNNRKEEMEEIFSEFIRCDVGQRAARWGKSAAEGENKKGGAITAFRLFANTVSGLKLMVVVE